MAVTLLAAACPLPTAPTTFIDPATASPTVSLALAAGDTSRLLTVINSNAARADAHGRGGGGAYAVTFGLGISAASGLSLTVASGQAQIDGPVTISSNQTLVLPDNTARVYVWLSQLGVLSTVSNSLTAPSSSSIFLGSAVSSGGAITSVDSSGIMKLCGGLLCRQSADLSTPTDVPPATVGFIAIGKSGIWLWDGAAYHCLKGGAAALTFPSDANRSLVSAEWENDAILFGGGGTTLTATRDVVMPLLAGRQWTVSNGSPGAQSLRFIGASGTGITVATGKTAILNSNGTNILRVTADSP